MSEQTQTRFDISKASDDFYYYGRVVKSYVGPASEEYQAKSNGRAGDQWHLEIEPLSFKYASGNNRVRSVNLPGPGEGVKKTSALFMRYEAFKKLGFDMPTPDKFGMIEGHVFWFKESPVTIGRSTTRNDWPQANADSWKPTGNIPVIGGDRAGGTVRSEEDPYQIAAELLDGNPEDEALMCIAGDVRIGDVTDILNKADSGELVKELVAKGLVTIEKTDPKKPGVVRKV